MSKILRGSFELMKQLNVSAVLKIIKDNGSLSRAEIAKLTGLTPASVTNITKFLIEDNFLIESKIGESSGGRPPIILEFNPDARYVVGVGIGVGVIDVVITNLSASIIIKRSMRIEEERYDYDLVLKKLVNLINEVVKSSKIDKEKILGVGVALHGIVNAKTGISIHALYYGWKNRDIKEKLEEALDLTVYVDNDVRAMSLGESWFGATKDIANFVTLNISNGIGAGIIINNMPYYGVDFSAGEIEEKILGVGVALHGIVNAKTGISIHALYYGWKNRDIKEKLEEALDLTVYVDNDVRAMSLGESWFGATKDIANFVTLNISNGIGAGIIINNMPYYGVDFSAGEIGHIVVEADGDKCNCGNYGCLETVASNNNITRKAIKLIKQGVNSSLSKAIDDINDLSIEDICKAANDGDELSITILKEAARYIGIAITNLINILNPTAIVVVGEIFENTTHTIETLSEI